MRVVAHYLLSVQFISPALLSIVQMKWNKNKTGEKKKNRNKCNEHSPFDFLSLQMHL